MLKLAKGSTQILARISCERSSRSDEDSLDKYGGGPVEEDEVEVGTGSPGGLEKDQTADVWGVGAEDWLKGTAERKSLHWHHLRLIKGI